MYCRYCGTKLLDNDKYCGKCGKKLVIEQPIQNENVVYVEEKKMDSILNNTAIVALTICVLVLSLTIIICASLLTNNIEYNRLNGINNIVDIM